MKDDALRKIWNIALEALGGPSKKENILNKPLSDVTLHHDLRNGSDRDEFQGKKAARKILENKQVFAELKKLNDPEIMKQVEITQKWLATEDQRSEKGALGGATVAELFKILFGEKNYERLSSSDSFHVDAAKAQVEPQPPKQGGIGQGQSVTDTSMDALTPQPQPGPPMGGGMGQQPQAPQGMMAPQPNNPMPPKPAGAEMGFF
jgi:hypothetical protein